MLSIDIVIYLATTIFLLFVMRFLWSSRDNRRTAFSLIKAVLLTITFTLLLAAILHWHTQQTVQLSNLIIWFSSYDTAFAHALVTFPLFFVIFYALFPISRLLGFILSILFGVIWMLLDENKKIREGGEFLFGIPMFFSRIVLPYLLNSYLIFLIMKFLMVKTIDLQEILTGNFDPSLGWIYPTTFRFTIIYEHMQATLKPIFQSSELTSLVNFSSIVVAIVLGIGALSQSLKNIGDLLDKEREQ